MQNGLQHPEHYIAFQGLWQVWIAPLHQKRFPSLFVLASQCEMQITATPLPSSPLCLLDLHAWIHLHWLKEKGKEMIKTFLPVQPHALFPSRLHTNSISVRHQWQGTAKSFDLESQTFQLLLFNFSSTFLVSLI